MSLPRRQMRSSDHVSSSRGNTRAPVIQRHPLSAWTALTLLVLLILPSFAALRAAGAIPWYIIPGLMSFFSLWVYFRLGSDKKAAQTNQWRASEGSLHWFEFLGGWPGSFVAQRRFRHKVSKRSYQFIFWLIVLAHQVIAFDYLNRWAGWKFVTKVVAEYTSG